MEKIKLAVQPRDQKKPRHLRREGGIPGTIYGAGKESESVMLDAREFSRLPVAAMSHMIELDNAGKTTNAVIRHVQRRGTTHHILNVEFYRVSLDKKLTVSVPLKFVGVSPAQTAGNLLSEHFQEAEVECLPAEIPDFIEVDISALKEVDDAIHFEQVKVPNNVKILNPHDEIIVKAMAPRTVSEEKEEAAAPAAKEAAEPAAEEAATET